MGRVSRSSIDFLFLSKGLDSEAILYTIYVILSACCISKDFFSPLVEWSSHSAESLDVFLFFLFLKWKNVSSGRKYPGGKTCQKALHLRVVMATDTGAWDFYDRNESRGDQMAAHLRLLYRCVLTVIWDRFWCQHVHIRCSCFDYDDI